MRRVGTDERRALLAERHRLVPARRTNDVVAIADGVVALHSSDPTSVFLSVFARMDEPACEAVEDALYVDRTLLRYHGMRRTLWVATPPFVAAMNAASTRKIAAAERKKLAQYLAAAPGASDRVKELEQLERDLMAVLHAEGPLTTREIGVRRPDLARKVTVGSGRHTADVGAHTRIASLAGFEGRVMRGRPTGSWAGSEYTWNVTDDWTSTDFDSIDEPTGAAAVLRAWLARFGPGTTADLRWWTGWSAAMVRRACGAVEAVEVGLDDDTTGWVLPDDPILDVEPITPPEPWVAVLPGLDSTTMGWKDRGWYLAEPVRSRVFDRNGNAGPTIWRNGEIVGGWVQRPDGDLVVELVQDLTPHETALLDTELDRLRDAIGDVRFRVRFPAPNQKAMLQ